VSLGFSLGRGIHSSRILFAENYGPILSPVRKLSCGHFADTDPRRLGYRRVEVQEMVKVRLETRFSGRNSIERGIGRPDVRRAMPRVRLPRWRPCGVCPRLSLSWDGKHTSANFGSPWPVHRDVRGTTTSVSAMRRARADVDYLPVRIDVENVSRCNFSLHDVSVSDWADQGNAPRICPG